MGFAWEWEGVLEDLLPGSLTRSTLGEVGGISISEREGVGCGEAPSENAYELIGECTQPFLFQRSVCFVKSLGPKNDLNKIERGLISFKSSLIRICIFRFRSREPNNPNLQSQTPGEQQQFVYRKIKPRSFLTNLSPRNSMGATRGAEMS